MEPTEEAFFEHIRSEFQDFELEYAEGAWERFQEKTRKKGAFLWRERIRVAAVIVIFFTGLLFWKNTLRINHSDHFVMDGDGLHKKLDVPLKSDLRQMPVEAAQIKEDMVKLSEILQKEISTTAAGPENKTASVQKDDVQKTAVPEKVKRVYPESTPDISITAKAKPEENRRWKINVSLSNDYGPVGKLKLGFGSSVEYALNKRVSISAGLAYTHVSAFDQSDQQSAAGLEKKSLVSVETAITGIDLPLELKYHISERSYVSIGISAIGILSKAQTLNYVANKMVQVTVYDEDGPRQEDKLVAQSESVPVASKALPQQDYLGFYNFSYGFTQKISKNNQVIFEPYVRLPMGTYSEQRSKLIATGLRIKVGL